MALLIAGLAASGTGAVARAPDTRSTAAVVVAHVENMTRLSASALAGAERIAGRTYDEAGVAIVWENDPDPSTARPPAEAVRVRLVLLGARAETPRADVSREGTDVLGLATVGADAPCRRIVYVLGDRLIAAAARRHYPVEWLLGEVIAHELGHVLLPTGYGHSRTGVMRPQVQVQFGPAPRLTDDQAELIRETLATNGDSR